MPEENEKSRKKDGSLRDGCPKRSGLLFHCNHNTRMVFLLLLYSAKFYTAARRSSSSSIGAVKNSGLDFFFGDDGSSDSH